MMPKAGGMYVFFAMEGQPDSRKLCTDILEKAHVGLAPGYLFGSASNAFHASVPSFAAVTS